MPSYLGKGYDSGPSFLLYYTDTILSKKMHSTLHENLISLYTNLYENIYTSYKISSVTEILYIRPRNLNLEYTVHKMFKVTTYIESITDLLHLFGYCFFGSTICLVTDE